MSADLEAIAQAHLTCQYPSRECDPWTAARAARRNDRETAALARLIEGYHDPHARLLIAATRRALGETGDEG